MAALDARLDARLREASSCLAVVGKKQILFLEEWGIRGNVCQRAEEPNRLNESFNLMAAAFSELEGLRVTVDSVEYMPHLEAPEDRPYPFVYFISIRNDSPETVTIHGRKWIVTDAQGLCVVVEGDGVVGKFPRLEPGENFSYSSYHVIAVDSVAEGSFFGVTEEGRLVYTRIPRFEMRTP